MMRNDTYSMIVAEMRKFIAKWRLLLVFEGLAYTAAFVALSVLLGFLSDNFFHFSPLLRRAILLLLLLGLAFLLYSKIVHRPLMRITPERAAVYIESRLGEFDNKLINALQLGKNEAYLRNEIINALVFEAGSELRARPLKKSLDLRRTKKSAAVLGVAAVLLLVYWLSFGKYFQNALSRFSHLGEGALPVTRINLAVSPGDITVFAGDDLEVSARIAEGPLPATANIVQVMKKKRSLKMEFDGERFRYSFRNLQRDFDYRVTAEDFRSRRYRVVVGEPLRIERVDMTLRFPEYLTIPAPIELEGAGTEVRVLEDTGADLRIFTNKPIRKGVLVIEDTEKALTKRSSTQLYGTLTVTDDIAYKVRMESSQGGSTTESLVRKILCFEDLSPTAEILEPKSDSLESGEKPLTVLARASDDVALASLRIMLEPEGGLPSPDPVAVGRWDYNEGPNDSIDSLKRTVIESVDLPLLDHLQAGQSALIYAAVVDKKGNEFSSPKRRISLLSETQQTELEEAEKESIFGALRAILDSQLAARSLVAQSKDVENAEFKSALDAQVNVHGQTASVIDRLNRPTQLGYANVKTVLLSLSSNEMVDVVKKIKDVSSETFAQEQPLILGIQDEIIRSLNQLLGDFAEEEEKTPEVEETPTKGPEKESLAKLEELRTILENFIEEQKKVITSSLELQKKKPDDYTQEDKDLRQKLQAVEDQWAKFLQEKSTELDKIPEQDFSKPTLLKELRQIYEEIEVAADELSKPGVKIPVTEEEVGLELAEKLEHNLESWLPNESDKIQWELEEPSTPPDVPMAELPEELEDIVGDLIREEQDLNPEMEDVSSSWMDSIDAGAGWDTMDGPISNMSAKGKTGNTLPNSSEISGRSAEGRSGKSNGEFVSDTAIGKGGRRTPTRLRNDPYENGTVDDRMTEATGGATGGGKRSGAGGEGLRGHVPPDLQTKLADLRGKHADLITRGERIMHEFDKFNLNTEKLGESLDKMRQLDDNMRRFKHTDLVAAQEEIIEELKASQAITSHEWTIRRELNARLPTKVRKVLYDTLNSEFPRDYEALLREYYKAISE